MPHPVHSGAAEVISVQRLWRQQLHLIAFGSERLRAIQRYLQRRCLPVLGDDLWKHSNPERPSHLDSSERDSILGIYVHHELGPRQQWVGEVRQLDGAATANPPAVLRDFSAVLRDRGY